MDQQRIIYLYQLYLDRNMTPLELEEFKQIILDPDQEQMLDQQIEEHWNKLDKYPMVNLPPDKLDGVFSTIVKHPQQRQRKVKLWPRLLAAAAIAMIFLSVYFFNYVKTGSDNLASLDIAPGKVGATLTLASGKKIKLTGIANGEIADESGISVTKTAAGQLVYEIRKSTAEADKINTLSTEKGETFMLTLPDRSKVWLNAASSLTYTASLNVRGKRVVKLSGEAYFEIAKDKAHPFIVESRGQEVEVLGTHFNISSYADETSVKTTLLEGVVRIAPAPPSGITAIPGRDHILLKPNEQAVLQGGSIKVRPVVAEDAIAWKNGYFMFDRETLQNIMTRIARWYNIKPYYEDESLKQEIFLGTISKYERISEVLHMLERTGGVSFKIDGNKVIISRNK